MGRSSCVEARFDPRRILKVYQSGAGLSGARVEARFDPRRILKDSHSRLLIVLREVEARFDPRRILKGPKPSNVSSFISS